MKILHLRASNFYGGPERQLHFHARQARGSEFTIIIGSFTEYAQTPQFLKVIAEDNIETHLFQVKNAYDPKAVAAVRGYLVSNDIRILCTHDYRTHLIGWLATARTDIRWVTFSRGWTRENPKVRLYHTIDKVILRFADHIVAVSESQKRKLTRLFIPKKKISVVHNATAPEQLDGVERVDLRSRFGFPSDTLLHMSAGRFSREKGQVYLVKAAVAALERNHLLRFVLFGDGPDLRKVRKLVAAFGCEDKILCPGFEKNVVGNLKGADVFVNPSLSEGLPSVVLEAMALGVPVVATAVGGVPEIITHRQTGYIVAAKDPKALAEGMLFMNRHRDQARKFAESALQFVTDNFTFDKQNRKLTAVYRKVLS